MACSTLQDSDIYVILIEKGQEIKAILFADAVGFSRLLEEQIPHFFRHVGMGM